MLQSDVKACTGVMASRNEWVHVVLRSCATRRHMKREGAITFNGAPSTKRLKRHIGFVMQVRVLLSGHFIGAQTARQVRQSMTDAGASELSFFQ